MSAASEGLQFLKLGGSLITDKARPLSARPDTLRRLAAEIASARQQAPEMRIILGHGSGSFGHVPAAQYSTRLGVHTHEQWHGFVEVWRAAAALNRLVMDALVQAGLPAIAFPPSAAITARRGKPRVWNIEPLRAALQAGLLPMVYGDVVFDDELGGTILSTEDLFEHLAVQFQPSRLLLAGIEPGVWADFPACTRLVELITPANLAEFDQALRGALSTDVTGGMESKVHQSLALAQAVPGLEVRIFSGEQPGSLEQGLLGRAVGTLLRGETGPRGSRAGGRSIRP